MIHVIKKPLPLGRFYALHTITLIVFLNLYFVLSAVTGMGANGGMFTSSSGHKALYHHMILLISTLMQMLTRSLFSCSN
jgi:hypothetical protein